jgi:hypothetical protein
MESHHAQLADERLTRLEELVANHQHMATVAMQMGPSPRRWRG